MYQDRRSAVFVKSCFSCDRLPDRVLTPWKADENFGRGVGGTLEGKQDSLQTSHHHHVNAHAVTRAPPAPPAATSWDYKSPQSPSGEHGGSSTSQVSDGHQRAQNPLCLYLNVDFLLKYLNTSFSSWLLAVMFIVSFFLLLCILQVHHL